MGRPRKRQKTDEETTPTNRQVSSPPKPIQPAPEYAATHTTEPGLNFSIDPNLSSIDAERTQFENICNGPVARSIRSQHQSSMQDTPGLHSGHSDTSQSVNGAPTPSSLDSANMQYPTDFSQWPDFSTLDTLPMPVQDKWRGHELDESHPYDPDADPNALSNLPSAPSCPCLPNMYLTLSTLATLSSFPFTNDTIQTLVTAHRTAKAVIYCNMCPQQFQSGSSNLMLSCTLLNVIAHQWNRLKHISVDELRKSFGTPEHQNNFPSIREGNEWKMFAHQMLRAYVFGDKPIPSPPIATNSPRSATSSEDKGQMVSLTLVSLVDSLTRRQRQWHHLDEPTDEFPDRVVAELEHGHFVGEHEGRPGAHLCLEIIQHARALVNKLDGGPSCH